MVQIQDRLLGRPFGAGKYAFIDSMTIWTRAATIRVNGHYFRRGNRESGVWVSRTVEEIEEMETFTRHKELFRPPMLIKGDKP